MPERYFEKFPIINYANNNIVDITRRVTLLNRVSESPYVFYPFELADNERAEQFSNRYYDDPFKSWILYLTNKITDPYYEWYLDDTQFYEFLDKKYGSYYTAQQKVKHYKNNWENQDQINASGYNALTDNQVRYWEPVYGVGSNVVSYKRKEVDWIVSTNKVISYTLVSNNSFTVNEICDIVFNNESKGKGQVVGQANNVLVLQHMSGTFYDSDTVSISGSSYIYGTESGANIVFSDVNALSNNITEDELIYWTPVTYFDYELSRNEYNKTIRVLEKDLSPLTSNNLRDLLSE